MRFCNKCGSIIIGLQCTNCFGMQLNSPRLRPLNKDLFIAPVNLNSRLMATEHIEKRLNDSNSLRDVDFSNKISQNRANLVDRKLELLEVAEELQKINSDDKNIFQNEIANQDPIMKARLEWMDSVKEDVNLKVKNPYKSKEVEFEIKPETNKIPEENKHNI